MIQIVSTDAVYKLVNIVCPLHIVRDASSWWPIGSILRD